LNGFRRKLSIGCDEADCCWDNILWKWIEDHARLVSECELPCLGGRQIYSHVDVAQVENRDDSGTGVDNLSRSVDQVLNPATARRDEREIDQDRVDPVHFGFGGLDCGLRRVALRFGGAKTCLRRIGFRHTLIEHLPGQVSLFDKRSASLYV